VTKARATRAFVVGQTDQSEHVVDAPAHVVSSHVERVERESDVLTDAHPREQRGFLEHRRAGQLVTSAAAGHDDASLGGRVEPGHDAQQRALTATARSDDGDELPVTDLEVHVVERERSGGIALREVLDGNRGHCARVRRGGNSYFGDAQPKPINTSRALSGNDFDIIRARTDAFSGSSTRSRLGGARAAAPSTI
jgi:hypothetical protein